MHAVVQWSGVMGEAYGMASLTWFGACAHCCCTHAAGMAGTQTWTGAPEFGPWSDGVEFTTRQPPVKQQPAKKPAPRPQQHQQQQASEESEEYSDAESAGSDQDLPSELLNSTFGQQAASKAPAAGAKANSRPNLQQGHSNRPSSGNLSRGGSQPAGEEPAPPPPTRPAPRANGASAPAPPPPAPKVSAKDILAQLKAQQPAQQQQARPGQPSWTAGVAVGAAGRPPPPPAAAPAAGPAAAPPGQPAHYTRYKTVHCKYYAIGACRKGDACTFIHDPSHKAEQQRMQQHQQHQQQYQPDAPQQDAYQQQAQPASAAAPAAASAAAAGSAARPAPGAAAAAGPGGLPRTFTGGRQAPLTGADRQRYDEYLRWGACCIRCTRHSMLCSPHCAALCLPPHLHQLLLRCLAARGAAYGACSTSGGCQCWCHLPKCGFYVVIPLHPPTATITASLAPCCADQQQQLCFA
jgi:hypothetical protein